MRRFQAGHRLMHDLLATTPQDAASERRFDLGKQPPGAGNEDAAFIGQSGAGLVSIEEPASRPGFDLHHGLRHGRLGHMDLDGSPAEMIAPRHRLEDPQVAKAWKLE